MNRAFVQAFGARVFAILSTVICGFASLNLYSSFLSPAAYGVVVVALTIASYLPLVDGGFRTTLNRSLLAEADSDRQRQHYPAC